MEMNEIQASSTKYPARPAPGSQAPGQTDSQGLLPSNPHRGVNVTVVLRTNRTTVETLIKYLGTSLDSVYGEVLTVLRRGTAGPRLLPTV